MLKACLTLFGLGGGEGGGFPVFVNLKFLFIKISKIFLYDMVVNFLIIA